MTYLKHSNNSNGNDKGKRSKKTAEQPAEQVVRVMLNDDPNEIVKTADSVAYDGLSEVAEQLSHIHNSLRSYNVNACDGEMTFSLVLEGDAVESIADSLKRIADVIEGKKNNDATL
jgi:hypothetical protein